MGTCDGCGKRRRDIRSIGRDANGDPDAPDMCFICRVELEHGRVWSVLKGRYIPERWACIECYQELDSYGSCENRKCCEWRGLAFDYALPIVKHRYTVVSHRVLA